jgi:hypothetical protein
MEQRLNEVRHAIIAGWARRLQNQPINPPTAVVSPELIEKLDEIEHVMVAGFDALLRQQLRSSNESAVASAAPTEKPPGLISRIQGFFGRGEYRA